MKVFYASLITFAILVGLICANTLYMNKTTDVLQEKLLAFLEAPPSKKDLASLEEYWEKRRAVAEMSLPSEIIWSFNERLAEVRSAVLRRDTEDLDVAVRLALDAVSRMEHIERLSLAILL